MRLILLLCLLCPFAVRASSFVTQNEFKRLSLEQQVKILRTYREFIQEYSKNSAVSPELESYSTIKISFINEAYAASELNCFYAGWPSITKTLTIDGKKKTFCASPLKGNPNYKKLSSVCQGNSLLCQPALFGEGLCADTSTSSLRNSAFNQCEEKFKASGRTLESVVKGIKEGPFSTQADEVFEVVHLACGGSGFQSSNSMCEALKDKVSEIRNQKDPEEKSELVAEPGEADEADLLTTKESEITTSAQPEKAELLSSKQSTINKTEALKDEIATALKIFDSEVSVVSKYTEPPKEMCLEEEPKVVSDNKVLAPYEASEAIDFGKKTEPDYCVSNQVGNPAETYFQGAEYNKSHELNMEIKHRKENGRRSVDGFKLRAQKYGEPSVLVENGKEKPEKYDSNLTPNRTYNYSFPGRGRENTLSVEDGPVKEIYGADGKLDERYKSLDIRITQYSFFPRKNVPSVKKRGEDVIMKLTTGEEIVLNATTGKIKGGTGKDVPPKNKTETFTNSKGQKVKLTYPESDFQYSGRGLFIESKLTGSKWEKEPGHLVPVKAFVDGGWQECKLKSDDLWTFSAGDSAEVGDSTNVSKQRCARLKFDKDEELYDMIKKKCPDFKFPPLAK